MICCRLCEMAHLSRKGRMSALPVAGTAAGLIFLLLFTAGCTIYRHMSAHDQLQSDLTTSQGKWEQQAIHDYHYIVTMGCDICSSTHGRFRAAVMDDTIYQVERDTAYHVSDTTMTGAVPTVSGLFTIIQNALNMPNATAFAHFEEVTGLPDTIAIDYDTRYANDNYTFAAESLTALP